MKNRKPGVGHGSKGKVRFEWDRLLFVKKRRGSDKNCQEPLKQGLGIGMALWPSEKSRRLTICKQTGYFIDADNFVEWHSICSMNGNTPVNDPRTERLKHTRHFNLIV